MTVQLTTSQQHRSRDSAFTLVELMVSVAMVVLLILGINQIFRITSDTINASTALGSAVRQSRAIQGTLDADFGAAMPFDAPFITLDSDAVYAFRNRADMDADQNGQPADWDVNEDGDETDSLDTVPATTYNFRNHRTDVLNFFVNSLLSRQTGNIGTYVSDMGSNEAWITYGHLRLYDSSGDRDLAGSYRELGPLGGDATTNPNNYFASNWVLGRSAILLRPEDSSHRIYDSHGVSQEFIHWSGHPTGLPNEPTADQQQNLAPLAVGSQNFGTPRFLIQSSRYDLAGATIGEYQSRLRVFVENYPGENWWSRFSYRFWANPFPPKPIDSRSMAQTAPMFIDGCSQFIVEFAGDFLQQDAHGNAIQPTLAPGQMHEGDGVIDFILDPPNASTGARRTRWYGAPRDVAGPNNGPADGIIDPAYDVVPVSVVSISMTDTTRAPVRPWTSTARPTFEKNAAADRRTNPNPTPPVQPSITNPIYVCAWGPYELAKSSTERPLMFRITVTVEDANNRLTEGQTYEYVFKLGM